VTESARTNENVNEQHFDCKWHKMLSTHGNFVSSKLAMKSMHGVSVNVNAIVKHKWLEMLSTHGNFVSSKLAMKSMHGARTSVNVNAIVKHKWLEMLSTTVASTRKQREHTLTMESTTVVSMMK
jgi:hypothetical protein